MRTRIGIGIEEPTQNPSPEVVHILKRIGLASNATIEYVRAAIQAPEIFAVLNTTDLAILVKHFKEPIEVGDDAVMGSKFDVLQGETRDLIRLTLAQTEKDILTRLRKARNAVKPDGGAKTDHLVGLLRAMGTAGQREHDSRKAGLIAKLRELSEQ